MAKFVEDGGYFHQDAKIVVVVQEVANNYCGEDEVVYVGIKGAYKEYLVATDKKIYLYKKGFMTGKTFGSSVFQLDYNSISAIQIHKQFGGVGYIEIVGMGMQNRQDLSYWKMDKRYDPIRQDNCLSFNSNCEVYETAVKHINELMLKAKNKYVATESKTSLNKFDEIKQYKELLDLGIITDDEFNVKKDELLNS